MAEKKNVKYSPEQKQKYHNKLAKPGATKKVKNKETGKVETRKVSDFERGTHKAKADIIAKARMRTFRKHNPTQGKLI